MAVPNGWSSGVLGDIASESKERFLPTEDDVRRYVGLEHIEPGVSYVRGAGSSSDVGSSKTVFESGDVLFGKLRPYLRKVALARSPGVCSTDILAVRAHPGVSERFLLNLLAARATIDYAVKHSAGTKMPRTKWRSLASMPVLVPPLPEQKKIAEILGSVDEAIQGTQAVIDQTRKVKQGLLQRLLTRGIGHTRFKQTEIGEIPESWGVDELVDLVPADRPIAYGVLKPGPFVDGGIPMLRITDIRGGRVGESSIHRISEGLDKEFRRTRLLGGETVISLVGTIGLTARVPDSLFGSNLHRNLGRIAPGPRVDSQYLPA